MEGHGSCYVIKALGPSRSSLFLSLIPIPKHPLTVLSENTRQRATLVSPLRLAAVIHSEVVSGPNTSDGEMSVCTGIEFNQSVFLNSACA